MGCGPVAWGMLFGWADAKAEAGDSYWKRRCGLYGGCGVAAPRTFTTSAAHMIEKIRDHTDTWCSVAGMAATNPWDMHQADRWLRGKTGTRLDTHYNGLGYTEDRLRTYARNSIRNRNTPAVIGTGWLTHYPLAYGYAWRSKSTWYGIRKYSRSFYINNGWSGQENGWVPASTWFAGEIRP